MAEYDQLAAEAEAAGSEIFWLGGVGQREVDLGNFSRDISSAKIAVVPMAPGVRRRGGR